MTRSHIPGTKVLRGISQLLFTLSLLVFSTALFSAEGAISAPESGKNTQNKSLTGFDVGTNTGEMEKSDLESNKSKIFPTIWCADIDHQATRESCWGAYQNGLDYYKFGLSHRQQVLEWQHLSTKIILFIVLTLVSMGLYFAWLQFQAGGAGQTSTEIEISTARLKISSPVLGVIILALSLAFFYLYLVYVYPIQEVI